MLAYTVYSEAGGVGKTTLAANLGVAHARRGQRVLLVDLDPQDGCLTYLLGIDTDRSGGDDNLVRHLVGHPQGPFADLVVTATDGVDVVPSHNMLERLTEHLLKAKDLNEGMGDDEWPMHDQLRRVLADAGVPQDYDVLIVDPPATAGAHLYNAINATRSVVVPLELSGKGARSVDGLQDVVEGLEAELDTEIGVLAVVPNGYHGGKTAHRTYLASIEDSEFRVPVVINERGALFGGCWDERCSAFAFVEEHRDRKRDREAETLAKFDDLAAALESEAGLGAEVDA